MNHVYVDCLALRLLATDTFHRAPRRIDVGRLYALVGGEQSDIGRAALYGVRPPEHDSIWEMARRLRFEVTVEVGIETHLESTIAADILTDSYELLDVGRDVITLVAGSAAYLPMLKKLRVRGAMVTVAFWNHGSAGALPMTASFVSLDDHIEELLAPG